ncbi:MAG: C45 family peptidase [Candidatus Omnitrophica bacterium]|nr:C45 family peptidase [Candidatus Omnitrophota bacterium]MCM8802144.1 C45 family peptidase [Candidatus Omnitrophota bacterium]
MSVKKIEIKGSYNKTGRLLGESHKYILKSIEEKVIKNIKIEKEKIKRYDEFLKKFSLLGEEIEGYCNGADIKFENLLKLKFGSFKILKNSCTSLFLSSKFFVENVPICLKIRDQFPLPQYICKKQNEDKIPYFFSGSISDIGYGFFIKENGLVGINNTGSFLKEEFVNEYGIDDCDVMRVVAEYGNKIDEVIEIIKKMLKDKIIGYTGKRRGMIFLFSEKENVIYIEMNSFNLNFKKIENKFGFTNDFLLPESKNWIKYVETEGAKSSIIRKKRLEEILTENKKFYLDNLIKISRDLKYYPYSICRDTKLMPVRTVSVFIAFLFENPVLWICLGNPYVSPFFPFFVKGNKIIENFINGDISNNLDIIFKKKQFNDDKYFNNIIKFEKTLNNKFNKIQNLDEKNIEIQKDVYNFIKEINESLYNT